MSISRRVDPINKTRPVAAIIEAGALPQLVRFLDEAISSEDLQLEATLVLALIACENDASCKTVLAAGAVPPLVKLLDSPNVKC